MEKDKGMWRKSLTQAHREIQRQTDRTKIERERQIEKDK